MGRNLWPLASEGPILSSPKLDQHKWVRALKSGVGLRFEGEIVERKPGDFISIPAHRRHQVKRTIWLAVFTGNAS